MGRHDRKLSRNEGEEGEGGGVGGGGGEVEEVGVGNLLEEKDDDDYYGEDPLLVLLVSSYSWSGNNGFLCLSPKQHSTDNIVVAAVLIIIDFDYENEEFGGFNVEMGNGSEFLWLYRTCKTLLTPQLLLQLGPHWHCVQLPQSPSSLSSRIVDGWKQTWRCTLQATQCVLHTYVKMWWLPLRARSHRYAQILVS